MSTVEQTPARMSAVEFGRRPDSGRAEELVRGRIIMSPHPGARRGKVCGTFARLLGNFVADGDLGHVLSNDAGVVTERNPDTVRGADVAFYSYGRLPKGELPQGYSPTAPELVCEVLSPSDRWGEALQKAGEYLKAGVLFVVVLDPDRRVASLFGADGLHEKLDERGTLRFGSVLPGFEVVVGRLFE